MAPADTPDVDEIAAATRACPAVCDLHEGGSWAVATYLPGRRVIGIRIEDHRVLASVVLAYGFSVRELEAQVRTQLAPYVGGRAVDVHVADVQTANIEAIAAATLACPAVADLHSGGSRAVSTDLPHLNVVGVRLEGHRVLVSVVLAYGFSVRELEAQVREALIPHVGSRAVDVHVAEVQTAEHPPEEAGRR